MSARLYNGDCLEVMRGIASGSIDLTVTSPPYDNLRTYNDSLNDWTPAKWQTIIAELFRVTKDGGVVVWVVADATINGSETGTSFRQALHAIDCGFRLHDTMIWQKAGFSAVGALATRYAPVFEFMFVFSKGQPTSFNPIKDRPNKSAGRDVHGTVRQKDGSTRPVSNPGKIVPAFGQRFNVWEMSAEMSRKIQHPAVFPLALAADHIASWSNPGDVVLDPFLGSGTTGVAAIQSGRRFIGIERDPDYFAICQKRIGEARGPGVVIDLDQVRRFHAWNVRAAALQAYLDARLRA